VTYVRPPERRTRAQKVTWCSDCDRWVGVHRGRSVERASFHREDKIVRHKGAEGRVCPRSGDTLPDGLVMDR
jgi:hypothetical protein